MDKKSLDECKSRMTKAVESLKGDFSKIRAGRATPSLLDGVRVEYYGNKMPMNQVATISVSDSRTLLISPWDKAALSEIEKAILKSDLGLTPINDGKVVRISLPIPTEERRKELVKQAKKTSEEARVSVRNIRREINEAVKAQQKEGKISEDDLRRTETEIQKLTDQFIVQVDQLLSHKEKEIMEV
ncbi:MAG: ribosome recycling factor [Deltaproteobacteria bacterium]|nr:ribosome recycling factor [Deltaproteobacteria bacterium]